MLSSAKTMLQGRRGLLLAAVVPLIVLGVYGSSAAFDGGSFAGSDTEATGESIVPSDDDQTDETDETDGNGEVVESSDGDQVNADYEAAYGVSPTSKQSLRDASTLYFEHTAGIYRHGLTLREDGSYSRYYTNVDSGFECIYYYEPSINTETRRCTGEAESGERYYSGYNWKNIPSTGRESFKTTAIHFGDIGPFVGTINLPLEESPDGIRSIPLITLPEGTDVQVGSLVLDIQTGLVVEAVSVGGDLLSSAVALVVGGEDPEHQANVERVKNLFAQADTNNIAEVDDEYQQLVSLDDAQERVSYQVPVVPLPDTFELSEVFYSRWYNSSPGVDVVIQIYRDGLREIVVTSHAFDPDSYALPDPYEHLERDFHSSPLDYRGVGYPREESGWSALIQDPNMPTHFWGTSNGAAVTVEGSLVSPAVLEKVRQQVITHPLEPIESETRDTNS